MTYLSDAVEVIEDGLGDFHEHHLFVDTCWEAWLVRLLLLSSFDDDYTLISLDILGLGHRDVERGFLTALLHDEQEV